LGAVQGLALSSTGLAGLAAGGGGGGGGVPKSVLKNQLEIYLGFKEQLENIQDQLMGIKQVDPFTYGSFRMGEARTMEQYNITVNGAIDSESTARQIVEILNDSAARGTLGAAGFNR
jgi:hypothetical protein